MNYNALERLGRHLYESMERLDPSEPEYIPWDDLPDHNRVFYITCVAALLDRSDDIKAALSDDDL